MGSPRAVSRDERLLRLVRSRPEEPIDEALAAAWTNRTAALLAGEADDAAAFVRTVAHCEAVEGADPIYLSAFGTLLERACEGVDGARPSIDTAASGDDALTRGAACELIYSVLDT